MMADPILTCPECGSAEVTVTAEQMFMVNTGEHYCHSVKTHDGDAKATCLSCRWEGQRQGLTPMESA
jgi:transcription elongation factor Elf1